MNDNSEKSNRALEYLFSHYQPFDAKLTHLVYSLPILGNQLYVYAQKEAQGLSQAFQPNLFSRLFSTLTNTSSKRIELLALCIFDLELCIYFEEVFSYCGDNELSSLLVDSLLYQATGYEASSPNQSEIIDEGTHNSRGIQKYLLGRQQFKHIGDTQAWFFGKEVGAIYGDPKDIAIIFGVSTFSIAARIYAKNACVFSLYGSLPNEAEQKKFQVWLEEMNKQLIELINKSP
jgi:hypothetical protein